MDIHAVIEEFKRYKIGQQNKRMTTAQKYGESLYGFFKWLEKYPNQVQKEDIVSWILYMKVEKKYMNNTQKVRLSAVRDFYSWFCRRYQYAPNPTEEIAAIQEEVKIPIMPTPDELVRMVYECREDKEIGRRDAALLCLLADTGIRVSECELLNVGDIQLHEKNYTVIVPVTKGKWGRIVPFGRLVKGDLVGEQFSAYWEEIKYAKHYKDGDPLFQRCGPTIKGGRLRISGIQGVVNRCVRRSGLNQRITVHSFRHFFATYSVIKKLPILSLKKLMGHAWISSTEKYVHIAEAIEHGSVEHRGTTGLKSKPHFTGYSDIARQIHSANKKNSG